MIKLNSSSVPVYKHNYSVLATPAEGLAGRFTRGDKKKFGIIPGVTDKDYYTNSNHVPVYYKCTPKHKAEIEGPYHALTGGGHIFYVEIDGDATHNPEAIMSIVDLMDKYDIGYCSVNLGIGVEFLLGDYLGLYIDPSLRYYFDNGQPKSIRTDQPLMLGFEMGLRVKL